MVARAPESVRVGETVLVRLDTDGTDRPLLVTGVYQIPLYERTTPTVEHPQAAAGRLELRVSGTLFCEPDDHTRPLFRGAYDRPHDPARLHGRPDRLLPLAYAELLSPGPGPGQWRFR